MKNWFVGNVYNINLWAGNRLGFPRKVQGTTHVEM